MPKRGPRPTVAVINTSKDVLTLLCETLEEDGFRVVGAYVGEFRDGRRDLSAFLTKHDPSAVLWDVAIPYERNWAYLQAARALPEAAGRTFVLSTTNKTALEQLVGPNDAIELVGRPFDLDELSRAVAEAVGRTNDAGE